MYFELQTVLRCGLAHTHTHTHTHTHRVSLARTPSARRPTLTHAHLPHLSVYARWFFQPQREPREKRQRLPRRFLEDETLVFVEGRVRERGTSVPVAVPADFHSPDSKPEAATAEASDTSAVAVTAPSSSSATQEDTVVHVSAPASEEPAHAAEKEQGAPAASKEAEGAKSNTTDDDDDVADVEDVEDVKEEVAAE